MDDYHRRAMGAGLPGAGGLGPAPRRGQDRDFDRYFDDYVGDEVPEGDIGEMRTAAWRTWRTDAPIAAEPTGPTFNEDDELERVLALSREELSRPASAQGGGPVNNEDDDLARAIAMSEAEARAPKRQRREETPEEERRMLEEALAASLASAEEAPARSNGLFRTTSDDLFRDANEEFQAQRAADRAEQAKARQAKVEAAKDTPTSSAQTVVQPASSAPSDQPGSANSLFADRARMEAERLARQNARLGGPSRTQSASSAQPTAASTSAGPSRSHSASAGAGPSTLLNGNINQARPPIQSPATSQARPTIQHPYQSTGPFPRDAAGEYYLDGELRHTSLSIGTSTPDPTFSANAIIGNKSQISLLILNSFVIDDDWLSHILPDTENVPQIIIRPHPRDKPEHNGKVSAQPSGEVWIFPKMTSEYASQHMKYLWIFYKTGRVRVIISTANFVSYDWEEIQNTIFIQDFLPLPSSRPLRADHKQHDFPLQFAHLFKHLKVHKALQFLIKAHPRGSGIPLDPEAEFGDLAKYDWSRVTVRLVLSIPGTYEGWENMEKWGLCRIGQLAKEEGWKPARGEKAVVEYQGSSLGTYGIDWFQQFYLLCSGKSARELANQPKAKSWAPINIIYPSLDTVDKSIMGRGGGGTMYVKGFNSVMRPHFHDCNSKSGGVLIHAKLLVTTFEPQEQSLGLAPAPTPSTNGKRKADVLEDAGEGAGGWMYIGSHNFSSAAWGTLNVKKSPPTLTIKNYELGIMFPLPREGARKLADRIVPYKRPARQYTASDAAWDQKLHMPADHA